MKRKANFLTLLITLCLLAAACLGAACAAGTPTALKVDTSTNRLLLDKTPGTVGVDLAVNREYTIRVAGTAANKGNPLPVIVMRGDAKTAVAWECLYNGNIRSFNSASVPKIAFFFAHPSPKDNTGSTLVTVTEGANEVASVSLDGVKNCVDLGRAPCAVIPEGKLGAEYSAAVTGDASIGGIPLPLLLVWEEDSFTRCEFARPGGGTATGCAPAGPVRAIFVGVDGQGMAGSAVVTFSPPSDEKEP